MNPSRALLTAARKALVARAEYNGSRAALRRENLSPESDADARERARAAQRAFHNANNILAAAVCQELGIGLSGRRAFPPSLPPHLVTISSAGNTDDDVDELTMPADEIAALVEHFDAREQAPDESAAASE